MSNDLVSHPGTATGKKKKKYISRDYLPGIRDWCKERKCSIHNKYTVE
jgi:hypothetical protein